MALANYTDLLATIAGYLQRGDLTSRIPDFVKLAEKRIQSDLQLIAQRTEATVTMTVAQKSSTLPTGFLDLISLRYTNTNTPRLRYVPMESIKDYDDGTSGQPEYFSYDESDFVWNLAPGSAYTLECVYSKGLDLANDATNWAMTNHPGLYLYGSLLESMPYIGADDRVSLWVAAYNKAEGSAKRRDRRNQDDGVLVTDLSAAAWGRGGYDINAG